MTADPREYLAVALAAADTARDLIRTRHPAAFTEKSDRDLVSDVDIAVERAIRKHLHQVTPGIGFLGEEEGGPEDHGTGWLWTLDPIDGTSNYAHGIPLCAASLALLLDGQPVLGVIDAPFLAERFHAVRGSGAWSGNRRLTARSTTALREAIVAIGDYATGPGAARKNETQLAATVSLTPRVHRIRMIGTAALDLAWVAAGRLDASITFSNDPWDTAAGVIIAREAGATVTDTHGTTHTLTSTSTIAATPALIPQLIPLVTAASPGTTESARSQSSAGSQTADLDRVLSRARYLLFDFDGPVRDPATGTPAGYIHEALAASRDSGRTPALLAAVSSDEVTAFLFRHGLDQQIEHVHTLDGPESGRPQIGNRLLLGTTGAQPSECAIITATAALVEHGSNAGFATIGYATTQDADERLTAAGADSLLPSLADLTLRLRARPLPN